MVAVLILAAGRSQRMGTANKLLLPWQGRPLLLHAVAAALASQAAERILVTGHEAEAVRALVEGLPLRCVHNPDYASGLAASLRTGLAAVSADQAGALVLLGDMPAIPTGLIDGLITLFRRHQEQRIIRPSHQGRPGNPVLWPRRFFGEMMELQGDRGARQILLRHRNEIIDLETDNAGIHFDIDTKAEMSGLSAGVRYQ